MYSAVLFLFNDQRWESDHHTPTAPEILLPLSASKPVASYSILSIVGGRIRLF